MAVSARSASFRSTPGYTARPTTTAYQPPKFTPTALPQVPGIDDARAPNATQRAVLTGQYGQIGNTLNAQLTGIQANTKQALAGYGGYKFREDDPNTPEREDLILDFDAGLGLGEREQLAIRGERNASNSRGMLYSSFAAQNQAQAVQRLSLEAQAIANQYASSVFSAQTEAANRQADIVGQVAQLYGQDAQFLAQNPPPTPDPIAALPKAGDGSPMIWRGQDYPQLDVLRARYPGQPLGVRKAGDGSYIVVIGAGAAKDTGPKQQAAGSANKAGNIVTGMKREDLSPGILSHWAQQYPDHEVVLSGDGKVVLRKKGK